MTPRPLLEVLPIMTQMPHQFIAPQNVMDELAAGLALGTEPKTRGLAVRNRPAISQMAFLLSSKSADAS
jgi:hypothetical protein